MADSADPVSGLGGQASKTWLIIYISTTNVLMCLPACCRMLLHSLPALNYHCYSMTALSAPHFMETSFQTFLKWAPQYCIVVMCSKRHVLPLYKTPGMGNGWAICIPVVWVVVPLRRTKRNILLEELGCCHSFRVRGYGVVHLEKN